MAFTRPPRVTARLLVGAAVVAALTVVVTSAAGATPTKPQPPTITSVMASLDRLADKAEVYSEKYNAALLQVQRLQRAADEAARAASAATLRYQAARQPLFRMAVAEYENSPTSRMAALMASSDQQAYLDALTTQNAMADRFESLAAELKATKTQADDARRVADKALRIAQAARETLAGERAKVTSQTARFRGVLATLTGAQHAAYLNRDSPTEAQIRVALAEPAPNGAAQRAVDFALAQIGKPYVFATAGPTTFDCSGLTMAAWAHAGVLLPHLSSAQYLLGRHVPYSALQPGDLVFLYSDLHHVELYIGNGLAISAPQEGEDVKIVRLADYASDFAGATRLA